VGAQVRKRLVQGVAVALDHDRFDRELEQPVVAGCGEPGN
jgi:hypothetical protein